MSYYIELKLNKTRFTFDEKQKRNQAFATLLNFLTNQGFVAGDFVIKKIDDVHMKGVDDETITAEIERVVEIQ